MERLNGYRLGLLSFKFCLIILLFLVAIDSDSASAIPIADAGLPRYAAREPVMLYGTSSYDPNEPGTLSYAWRQISGPTVIISDANTATPTISGFVQTDEIQECEFELVVWDGESTSLPDSVKVIIVPDFGANIMRLKNDSFDPEKPTVIYFGGGDCWVGTMGLNWDSQAWIGSANVIDFPGGYGYDVDDPYTYFHYADMIIVYLSAVAPDYQQPIQTIGWSTGGQPAIDMGINLNLTYADARYAVNRVTLLDVSGCRDYSESINQYLGSSVDNEQCWIDHYMSSFKAYYPNILNVNSAMGHSAINNWYRDSITNDYANDFNNGVIAGAYWSVIGPGSNLQLASTPGVETYSFKWDTGYMDFYDKINHPGRLPEPVTLVKPVYSEDHNGVILSCEESENAVGYELMFGNDPYRVMDYNIISDTPGPPNNVITTLPYEGIWWTVRVRDQYGSTIYADPRYISMFAYNPNPADGVIHPNNWAYLTWTEGRRATSYNVYFGESFVDVRDGTAETFRSNQTSTYFIVGFPGFPYPNGLVPGTTYFWRIDDVGTDGTSIHMGNIWSFTVSP